MNLIPDAEALVHTWLSSHPAIEALDTQIVPETPGKAGRVTSWVRVHQLDAAGERLSTPEHLVNFMLQFDSYAGAGNLQEEASALNRTVRAALKELEGQTVDDAVVSAVRFTSNPRLPDTDLEPARERYSLTAEIFAHAA